MVDYQSEHPPKESPVELDGSPGILETSKTELMGITDGKAVLSSCAMNSISEMTNGWVCRSRVKSGCPELEWVGVVGTRLQLMCCAILRHLSLILEDGGQIGDDFVNKDKSQTRMMRKRIQVVEQEEDLRD